MVRTNLTLFLVMFFAGCVGGIFNAIRNQKDEPGKARFWAASLLGGLVASFMVPLFLNMISSNLIDAIRGTVDDTGDTSKLFVLAGFCLVAAVSSTAFITTISDRILKEAQQTRREVKQMKKEVEPIIDKQTEKEPQTVVPLSVSVSGSLAHSDTGKKVLNALANSQYTLRTRTGIAAETGMQKAEVNDILKNLVKQDLVRKVQVMIDDAPRPRWYLSPKGRLFSKQ